MDALAIESLHLYFLGAGRLIHGRVAGPFVVRKPEASLGNEERFDIAVGADLRNQVVVFASVDLGPEASRELGPEERQSRHPEEAQEGGEGRGPRAVEELAARDGHLLRR